MKTASRFIARLLIPVFYVWGLASGAAATPRPLPRTILALYDSTYDQEIQDTPIHQIVEMPLNHLGLIVRYHDINKGLPRLEEMQDVRGVITWFESDAMVDPLGFLAWADSLIASGRRIVVIGELSASRDFKNHVTPLSTINRFWGKLGLRSEDEWTTVTYAHRVVRRVPSMVEFERPLEGVLPAFAQMKKTDPSAVSYLKVRRESDSNSEWDLVVTNRNGGYIAGGYAHYHSRDFTQRQWYINPFEFFRIAFDTDNLPKPDTTTLMGRRIFYSHVDGDGWRNLTEVSGYKTRRALSAEVILSEVIRAFPDLPFTVAPIAADIDPEWYGTPESLDIARRILALPNVEAGTHTYSHPLDWKALVVETATTSGPTTILGMGMAVLPSSMLKILSGLLDPAGKVAGESRARISTKYEKPRTYDLRPFDLDHEIRGSAAFISKLLPVGKKLEVVQWSGDTTPFEAVVAASRAAGLRNINGGATRYDEERLSYGWVSPLGRQVGSTWQIYASNSNENNYTELWTDRFFGFRYLTRTINNTESPRRVKPINVYYHMYSGEKLSSLRALKENLQYASSLEICPITAKDYAAIADGFYTTSIDLVGPSSWRIRNRGDLQTIRFDAASDWEIDFRNSTGIIGQRYETDRLYVTLDAAANAPIVTLQRRTSPLRPYLIQSRWRVSDFDREAKGFRFVATGYGTGFLKWKLPHAARVSVKARDSSGHEWKQEVFTDPTGVVDLRIPLNALQPLLVTVGVTGS